MRELIRHILREELVLEMPKKSNTEDFIRKAKEIHGDKYDYTPTNYVNTSTKVEINCPKHGNFVIGPSGHLSGRGCQLCGRERTIEKQQLSPNEFIKRATEIHKGKYDYTVLNYQGFNKEIKFICPLHGIQSNIASAHLNGSGCKICGELNRREKITKNNSQIIDEFQKVHGDLYDYSDVDYSGIFNKVKIICPFHGPFEQVAKNHLDGYGCQKCGKEKQQTYNLQVSNLYKQEFIRRAEELHGNKYDYSQTQVKNSKDKIKIICPKHGEFFQIPDNHLRGIGCEKCGLENAGLKRRVSQDEFIKRANEIHGNAYDYSQIVYTTMNNPVNIICNKHGYFSQLPMNHLNGQGCPVCKESKGVKFVSNILKKLKIDFVKEKKFNDCVNVSGEGKYCKKLPFDIYIPDKNTVIEYDGEQHFKPVTYWGGEESFIKRQKLDKIKNDYCEKNNIKLIRIPYTVKFDDIEIIIKNELGL